MILNLSKRADCLHESLENDDCDADKRRKSYRHFALMNQLLSRWRLLYRRFIRPALEHAQADCRLLDIGFGGADIPLRLLQWAQADGFRLQVTCIDRNPKALEFVQTQAWPPEVEFFCSTTAQLVAQGHRYDIVISNHILHELAPWDMEQFVTDADSLASKLVLFNDIRRSTWGYYLFAAGFGPVLRNSFAVGDGLLSIRRAYTVAELRRLIPQGWKVEPLFPFRLLLIRRKP
jgi:2-polyprenyl-3-methyl-5-hydroxy-6-metoxy-1,4-benzoquinol methylase